MTHYNHEYSRPIEVQGGIKATSRRGEFGSSWWAQRWSQTLEQFHIGARLSRGRSYARRGQVLSIDIENGAVHAQVQGSRKRPYDVRVSVRTIDPEDWERLRRVLADQPVIAATLLADRMPGNIEDSFRTVGLSMFPETGDDLETDCSCPDWSNPCKHVAAVYLLLGEEFDRDPFQIFRMRGMNREELLGEEFRQSAQTLGRATTGARAPTRRPGNVLGQSAICLDGGKPHRPRHGSPHQRLHAPATWQVPILAGRTGTGGHP